jgi:exosortase/archaeosortase family protein
MRGPLVDRLVVLASAVPIALAANVLRIVITGLTGVVFGAETADLVFHDLAGLIMMPLALGMLWLEMQIMGRLLVEVVEESPTFDFGLVEAKSEIGAKSMEAPQQECVVS